MNGNATTNATTNRRARLRHPAARIAGPALALLLTVAAAPAPAQAVTPAAATTAAATTWSQLMQRKLGLSAEATRLTAQLPVLRTAAATRATELTKARHTQAAALTTLTQATTAEQTARTRFTTAKSTAATAKKAVAAAQKLRPRNNAQITKAQQALTAANATVKARLAVAGKTTAALKTAQTGLTTATQQVAKATIAGQNAAKAITDAQARLASLPKLDSTLAAQAAALSSQAVTQTRATFTIAQTTKVYGVTVNKIVAYPFQRMIDDAAKAGVQLSGGGFRTKQQQIALRTTNGCPDIWTAPASSCRVPTAIPGRSLHELGLAIDITSGKKTINDRKSAAFKWLAANAGKYGFVNLPSEPWHWSITGG